jgi:phosphomethylpyrimidine synthase
MSQVKMIIKNRRSGKKCLCGDEELVVVFPYGLSPLASSIEEELQKVRLAERLGIDMVKDNSVGRKEWFRLLQTVAGEIDLPIGASATLAAANLAVDAGKNPTDVSERLFFNGFEKLAEVCDAIEIFPTITQESLKILAESQRVNNLVISRAGNIVASYIEKTGRENPFCTDFDWFLDQAKEKEITLILGNGLRAACLADCFDETQMFEIKLVKEFAERAVAKGVRIVAGVFGHIDPSKTEFFETIRREIPIPIGGLGPLSTDLALGYDHINAAISIVVFRQYIDWVSIITPAEHIGMPSFSDAADGITAFNIARHILDLKAGKGKERDLQMAKARMYKLWCAGMSELSLNPYSPAVARVAKEKWPNGCTLCGNWCPFVSKPKNRR